MATADFELSMTPRKKSDPFEPLSVFAHLKQPIDIFILILFEIRAHIEQWLFKNFAFAQIERNKQTT